MFHFTGDDCGEPSWPSGSLLDLTQQDSKLETSVLVIALIHYPEVLKSGQVYSKN